MNVNALDWYKTKTEEISSHRGYIRNLVIDLKDADGLHIGMGLDWLFDSYSPQCHEIVSINDEIKFTQDGTPLHEIAIFLKETPENISEIKY